MEDQLTSPSTEKPKRHVSGVGSDPHSVLPVFSLKDFEGLYHQYYKYLCLTASAILKDDAAAEDVVQEFYISYWDRQQDTLNKANFRSYAKKAISNDCIDLIRKKKLADKWNSDLELTEESNPESESELLDESQRKYQLILDLVAELPESRRQILILHAVDQLSYAQIAEKQSVSINTVKTQLSRAYKTLRSHSSLILISILIKF